MESLKNPDGYWSKEKCEKEAIKYNTRTKFSVGSKTAYRKSVKNKWIEEFFKYDVKK